MEKRLAAIVIAFALLSPALSFAQSACPSLSRNVFLGARGADVISLQNFLISENLLAAGNNTGYFGHLTQTAVISFQASHGVPSTGLVGPLTRASIVQACGTATVVPPNPPTGNLSISSISPQSGPAGTTVSLTGHFERTGAIVITKPDGTIAYDNRKVNTTAGYYSGDGVSTSFIIPEDAGLVPGAYLIYLTGVSGKTNSQPFTITALQGISIDSISPTSPAAGATATIHGSGFGNYGNLSITLHGQPTGAYWSGSYGNLTGSTNPTDGKSFTIQIPTQLAPSCSRVPGGCGEESTNPPPHPATPVTSGTQLDIQIMSVNNVYHADSNIFTFTVQ